jgi:hypothetical protein
MRIFALLLLFLVLGQATTDDESEAILRLIQPTITYRLDVEDADADLEEWQRVANAAAQLVPLQCPEDMIGSVDRMLKEAESGDVLAMAGLGAMFLLGQECEHSRHATWEPTQNLTWGLHWLTLAAEQNQADAQALLGFLHLTDVLHDIYGYRDLRTDRLLGRRLLQQAADGGSFFCNYGNSLSPCVRHRSSIGQRRRRRVVRAGSETLNC